MDETSITAFGAALIAFGGILVLRQIFQQSPAVLPPSGGVESGWLPVLDATALLEKSGAHRLQNSVRAKIGLSSVNYVRDCETTLARYVEFVQLLPASESHHHAQPGGLIVHALETADIALAIRRSHILPPDAVPEDIARLEHRWTFGVFLAALAHDVGKAMADLRVEYRSTGGARLWSPVAGSMNDCGAQRYRVEFTPPTDRDYQSHQKLPVVLMQRIVPQSTMAWLAEDGKLVQEIMNCLSGNYDGPIGVLVRQADRLSVANNLRHGPRTRFRSARAVPVIERLMEALRRMLQEGGTLPLNRSGAAGWVFEGDIWFVSKRLADEVREYLQKSESGQGIPGDDKNDRLFDIWQEYGALVPNPASGGAIWRGRVEGQNYAHDLTLLRFPLSILFATPKSYPAAMEGRITTIEVEADMLHQGKLAPEEPAITAPNPAVALTVSKAAMTRAKPPVQAMAVRDPDLKQDVQTPAALVSLADQPPHKLSNDAVLPDDDYLAADDTAQRVDKAAEAALPSSSPLMHGAVTAMNPRPPGHKEQQTPLAAQRFMAWVQRGLADGSIAYNETGAMVHFVEAGMLLVSPRVFREFAGLHGESGDGKPSELEGDKIGTGIQREVIRAGWHLFGPKKVNVLRYQVKRRNGSPGIVLSGMVIVNPARFVNPVPAINQMLVPPAEIETSPSQAHAS
jgi:integrating conjugative element relaxase (TIGR03760 family)